MPFKDPIFGLPMEPVPEEHVKLTPTERAANGAQMQEHRVHKCGRCLRRYDFQDGGYICQKGLYAKDVMAKPKLCKSFHLDEDWTQWRHDLDES